MVVWRMLTLMTVLPPGLRLAMVRSLSPLLWGLAVRLVLDLRVMLVEMRIVHMPTALAVVELVVELVPPQVVVRLLTLLFVPFISTTPFAEQLEGTWRTASA